MQRAGDARAARLTVLTPQRHQAGRLVLGEGDLLAAELGKTKVGNLRSQSPPMRSATRPLGVTFGERTCKCLCFARLAPRIAVAGPDSGSTLHRTLHLKDHHPTARPVNPNDLKRVDEDARHPCGAAPATGSFEARRGDASERDEHQYQQQPVQQAESGRREIRWPVDRRGKAK